jgi:hypothetical protein
VFNDKSNMNEDIELISSDCEFIKVKNLKIGSELLTSSGSVVKVTKIIRKNKNMYKITPNKSIAFSVSGDHVLHLKFTNAEGVYWSEGRKYYKARYIQDLQLHDKCFGSRTAFKNCDNIEKYKSECFNNATKFLEQKRTENGYNKIGDILIITVDDYLKLSVNIKRILYMYKEPIIFDHNDVDLEPYMLGLWLGDGTSAKPAITNIDKEIIDYIYDFADAYKLKINFHKLVYNFRCDGKVGHNHLINMLNQYELFNNKHIPKSYLINTRANRLQLLAGLIDTDGSYDKLKNLFEIAQKSNFVAFGIVFVARSLGFRVSCYKREKTCVKPDGSRVKGMYNIITISGEKLDKIPTLIPRKHAKCATKDVDFLIEMIKIEKLQEKQLCYEVEYNKKCTLINSEFFVM